MTNELMNRVQIDEITAGRDAAIAKWLEAYDSFHALTDAANGLCFAGGISLPIPADDRYSDSGLTRAFHCAAPHNTRDRETGAASSVSGRDHCRAKITVAMDRRCWRHLPETLARPG